MAMHSSSRNGAKVIWLAVHTTEGMATVQALRDWTAWAGSSHAASDSTGALWGPAQGFVPYDRAAWTLRSGNPISENIEQCGWAKWTRAEWLARPKLLDATARWLAERSKARNIPLVRLNAADIRARKPGILGHGDYSLATNDGTHWDPGPGYPWDVVLAKANAYRYPTGGGGQSVSTGDDDMAWSDAEKHRVINILERLLIETMGPDGPDAGWLSDEQGHAVADPTGRKLTLLGMVRDIQHEVRDEFGGKTMVGQMLDTRAKVDDLNRKLDLVLAYIAEQKNPLP